MGRKRTHTSSIGRTELSLFLGGNLIKVGGINNFYCFPSSSSSSFFSFFLEKAKRLKSDHHIWVWPYRPDFSLLAFSRKNDKNEEVEEEEEGKQ